MPRKQIRKRAVNEGQMLHRNQLIASAAATLEVLEVIADAGGPMPLTAIVQATGKPKGTIHRMLATLTNTGFLTKDLKTNHYGLTLKLWRLGTSVVGRLDVVQVSRPWLERLVAATDETVHVAVLDVSGGIVYVSKLESPRSIRVQTRIGQLTPAWCTATGRCILAFQPSVAERVLSGPLEPRTPKTITDPNRIRALLRDIAAKGYAVARAENHPEMGGVAVPIRDHTGAVVASIGVALPIFRMTRELVDRCVPHVVRAAADISAELGYESAEVELSIPDA